MEIAAQCPNRFADLPLRSPAPSHGQAPSIGEKRSARAHVSCERGWIPTEIHIHTRE